MVHDSTPQRGAQGDRASRSPTDFLRDLLKGTEGLAVLLDDEGREHLVETLPDVEDVLLANRSPRVRLTTDDGEVVGVALSYGTPDEALAGKERYGEPSFTLAAGERIATVWLLSEPSDAEEMTVQFAASQFLTAVPIPGLGEWGFADNFNVSGDYSRFALQSLSQKFGSSAAARAIGAPATDVIPFGASTHNDAIVYGVLPDDVLAREITIALGKDARTDSWPNKTMPIGTLVNMLSSHKVGAKDGACFITGETVEKKRKRNSIKQMFMLGLDVDNGTSLSETVTKLRERGQFAIVYTTHSHMKTVTDISQSKFYAWAKKAKIDKPSTSDVTLLRAFLREVRSYTSEIADSVRGSKEEQTGEGIKIFVEHAPIPKFRIMFPLETPYAFQQPGLSQQETVRNWGRKILGMAHDLQLSVDEACIDPSRLFYGPRHAQGRPFEVHVIPGSFLDVAGVSEVDKGETIDHSDPFAAAAFAMGVKEKRDETFKFTKGGIDLWKWNRERGIGFELRQALLDHAPSEFVKFENGDAKLIVVCPFDEGHSDPGNDEDVACMVQNASDHDDAHPGFKFSCRHASCIGYGKVDFLCKAIELDYLPESALNDGSYMCTEAVQDAVRDDRPSRTDIERAIKDLTKQSSSTEIEKLLKAFVRLHPTKLEIASILKALKTSTGASLDDLRGAMREAGRELRNELRRNGSQSRNDEGLLKIYHHEEGFPNSLAAAKAELLLVTKGPAEHPNKTPRLFSFGRRLHRAVREGNDALQLQSMSATSMINELNRTTRWIEIRHDDENEVQPPKNIAEQILVDDEAEFPRLDRIVKSPFFDRHGNLVATPGYHAGSRCYYDPPPNFVLPLVPSNPTTEQALEAREFVLENLFPDFPFSDGDGSGHSSRAHALSLLLLFFMRDMIPENTPAHFLTKPSPGTGASLLIDMILLIATGQTGVPHVEKESAAEERKAMTARLLSAPPYFWLDNINKGLDSSTYALALTTGMWADRILGGNEETTLPVTWSWIFSGNNVDVSAEMARRLLPIRLFFEGDPTTRTKFKHNDLPKWVATHRGALVCACLTMIRYWINKGCPEMVDVGRRIASYESWSRKMGGLLETLGIEGFLGNLHLVRNRLNEADEGFESLVTCWLELDHADIPRPVEWRAGKSGLHSLVDMMEENGIELGFKAFDRPAKVKSLSSYLHKRAGRAVTIRTEGEADTVVILREQQNRVNTREFWLERPRSQ